MTSVRKQDPDWQDISASLRAGILYVKMPRAKVALLLDILLEQEQDLLRKRTLSSDKCLVFSAGIEDWNQDLKVLTALEDSPLIRELVAALRAGFCNEARVDWITRVGGPPPQASDALESLTLE